MEEKLNNAMKSFQAHNTNKNNNNPTNSELNNPFINNNNLGIYIIHRN